MNICELFYRKGRPVMVLPLSISVLVLWVINSVTYFMLPFCIPARELKAWKAGP